MTAKFKLKNWLWVLYPITAFVFMIWGINFLLTAGQANLSRITYDKNKAEAEEQRLGRLETKLVLLKTIDINKSRQDLAKMLEAVPPARQVWMLMGEISKMTNRSGLVLNSYKGDVGDIQEATESGEATPSANIPVQPQEMVLDIEYKTTGIQEIARAVETAEKFIPLVKIVKIDFSKELVTMRVEGAWAAWPATVINPEAPLNFNLAGINKQLMKLEELEKVDLGLSFMPATGSATFSAQQSE